MKKLFALASMMLVLSVSAQQSKTRTIGHHQDYKFQKEQHLDKRHQDYPKRLSAVDQQLRSFEHYDLSSSQKKKIKTLLERQEVQSHSRQHQSRNEYAKQVHEFNQKIKTILSKKQYQQYQKDQQKRGKRGF